MTRAYNFRYKNIPKIILSREKSHVKDLSFVAINYIRRSNISDLKKTLLMFIQQIFFEEVIIFLQWKIQIGLP